MSIASNTLAEADFRKASSSIIVAALALVCVFVAVLSVNSDLPLGAQLDLVGSLSFSFDDDSNFEEILFTQSTLPRAVMAVLVGSILGLVGSVLQQLTQNHLVSPLTIGTSAGAWLAMVVGSVSFPMVMAEYSAAVAMAGSLFTFGLVVLIVGLSNLSGLSVVLAGMAVNILMGAIATAITLLNDQYAKNLFIWGAGDLAQNGWENLLWLVPKLLPAILIVVFAPRVLALLRLGQSGAQSRGLSIVPAFFCILLLSLWLVSASISTVGVISFIGLLSPNIARALGARTPRYELLMSALLGALLLLVTDWVAIEMSYYSYDFIPSGTTAALIGAPALIFFTRRKLKAQDQISISLPKSHIALTRGVYLKLIGCFATVVLLSIFVTQTGLEGEASYAVRVPDTFTFELMWPRLLTAVFVGSGLSVAGVLLQRLIYNPLASPDILGLSSGATFVLVAASIFVGVNIFDSAPLLAFMGSMSVLVLLLILGRKNHYAPSMLILTGIALTALIDSLVQFALSRANEDSYAILTWLSGSTYRVTPSMALTLGLSIFVLASLALVTHRWLTLLSAGRAFAQARGLNVPLVFAALFVLVALICAITTAVMGPVGFLGMLAPHMAVMLGARKVKEQIVVAMLAGSTLLVLANWLGQTIRYPAEIAAGTIVSVLGGGYFLLLLFKARMSGQ
ncbi:Fe(3+)-hydroxamate ABC transporter permease FhuB [Vibrio mexicanus]|uniref:Fe(3+)-hydroxamate ABC transporter permease FhuB n=1 Tax=Vibrio mexicanus TaxID=1004326 RepID=UPI000A025FCB|nr:Fe(3+)-hydroxamate ABC transporter permease FhuB [Vibrio mexicanus]